MIAAKFGDPVLGIDIHMVLVPAPPAPAPVPTPLPHPFVGVVFDPIGAAIGAALGAVFGGGGPVFVNNMPVGNTGTDVKGVPHFPTPPGVSFAPNDIPGNEGTIILGSKTVSMAGSSEGRLGSMVMSCNFPINLPTSVCLSVPMGPPVLIGGPDSLDILAAVTRGIRTKWFSDFLHKVLKPGPKLSKLICFLTGHPVDVMSGEVLADARDVELPGPIPLVFERNYYSRSTYNGPLGRGWTHSLDVSLCEAKHGLLLRLPDGREREHAPLADGQSIWDDIDRYSLLRSGDMFRMTTWDGRSYLLEPIDSIPPALPDEPEADRPTHRLARISDRSGNAISLVYEERRRLVEAIDSAGRRIAFSWTHRGDRLERIVCAGRTLIRYHYDEHAMLASATDAEGYALQYAYQGAVLVRETNRNGLNFYFEYDEYSPDGWCVRTWGDGGIFERKIEYLREQHFSVVDDGRGGRTLYYGNAAGLVDREVDPTGREKRYVWNEHYRKIAELDGLGNRREWVYDAFGNTLVERDATGAELRRVFNALNLPTEIQDQEGGTHLLSYDSRGCLTMLSDASGAVHRFSYDERGLLREATAPTGKKYQVAYNEAAQVVESIDWEGTKNRYDWDAWGRIVRHEDGRGAVTVLERDACHRIVGVRRPDGSLVRLRHDGEGNVIERTNALGYTARYGYTGLNRLAEQIDPMGGCVKYTYDSEQSLTGIVNEHGERYLFEVDLAGRTVKEVGFDGRTLVFRYDAAGRCSEMVNGLRKVTKFERDPEGRVIKQLLPGMPTLSAPVPKPEEIGFGYNKRGQLVRIENKHAVVSFTRDRIGRVLSEIVEAGGDKHILESWYNDSGHRIARTTSLGHETQYDVDGGGMLRGLSFSEPRSSKMSVLAAGPPSSRGYRSPWRVAFQRDAEGAELERRLPGGVVARWDRDNMGRGRVLRAEGPWNEGFSRGYQWRADDQLGAIIDGTTGPLYLEHDPRGYLVSGRRADGSEEYRSPDAAGWVYRSKDRRDRVYGQGGVLRRAGGVEYVHDDEGQLVEKRLPDGTTWKYRWDGAGQLVEVIRPDGEKVAFAYDGLGRRLWKRFGAKTTRYVWDGNDLVHEIRSDGPLVTWEFEPGRFAPLAKVEGERRFGVIADHLGAPVAMFDEAGRIAWKAQLDLYGVARKDVMKSHCPWRFPGQYEDEETGLYYNRFRYYDPESGRYITQDPLGIVATLWLFEYVGDPFAWIDPLGLACGPARKGTDWDHIFEGHWHGSPPIVRGANDIFGALEKGEIKQVVDLAWSLRKKVQTQGERIRYIAQVDSRLWKGPIEMWFNTTTKILETAYPKGVR